MPSKQRSWKQSRTLVIFGFICSSSHSEKRKRTQSQPRCTPGARLSRRNTRFRTHERALFQIQPHHPEVRRKVGVSQNHAGPRSVSILRFSIRHIYGIGKSDTGGGDGNAKGKDWFNPTSSACGFGARQFLWRAESCCMPVDCIRRNARKGTLGSFAVGHFGSLALPGTLLVYPFRAFRRSPPSLPLLRAIRLGFRHGSLIPAMILPAWLYASLSGTLETRQ